MKIGILTQPLGHNYGGILQNYALQEFLRRKKLDVETVNLRGLEFRKSEYSISRLRSNFAKSVKKLARSYISQEKLCEPLESFITENISITQEYETPIQRNTLNKHGFDCFIVGSDQVWKPSYSPNLLNYFLDFTVGQSVKRIAYAASFGSSESEFDNKRRQSCGQLLKAFDAVSVREYSGITACYEMFSAKAEMACDPTLLLDSDDYSELIHSQSKILTPKNYCVAYFLNPSKEKLSLLNLVSKKLNLMPVSLMPSRLERAQTNPTFFSPSKMLPVADWLGYIENSSFILTDSFHGTIFSAIFKKPFLSINNYDRGSDRIPSFLKLLNLDDRMLQPDQVSTKDFHSDLVSINWQSTNSELSNLIENSKQFLSTALKL